MENKCGLIGVSSNFFEIGSCFRLKRY